MTSGRTPNKLAKFSLLVLVLSARSGFAGGLTLPIQGVRSLERGGALVAGAEDADALWQNPAGLAHLADKPATGNRLKQALLFDAALLYQSVDHTRVAADGTPFEPTSNEQPGTLVPSLAGALRVTDQLVIAGGLASPMLPLPRYGADGPQRYAGVALDGSRLVMVTAGIAYRANDRLRVGATISNLVSKLAFKIVASGCPAGMTCAPEDRTFDMPLTLDQTDAFSPTASAGVQYDASSAVTLGLVIQAPLRISAAGTLAIDLPNSPIFDNAMVTGDTATLSTTLPGFVRAGVEWHTRSLRIEAALAVEPWSLHDDVTLAPDNVTIDGAAGGPFALSKMTIARDFKTSWSPAVAIEWHGPKLQVGGSIAYETAAAPTGTVSVLAVDAARTSIAIGGGYEDAGWQIGIAGALLITGDTDVAPADANVDQLAPLGGSAQTGINAGSYKTTTLVGGLRFARRW